MDLDHMIPAPLLGPERIPEDTLRPTSQPIASLADLANWEPGRDPYNVATVPRPSSLATARSTDGEGRDESKTIGKGKGKIPLILCHDMGGGYNEDKYPQGTRGINSLSCAWTLQYWQYVDIFIYFTHYRITIPPPGWTNVAHRNGSLVLGTFITEWEPGVEETFRLVYGPTYSAAAPELPNSLSPFYADKLVEMAVYYNFDGWFLNFESSLVEPPQKDERADVPKRRTDVADVFVPHLVQFLKYFTDRMHAHVKGSKVLWYDSMTLEGYVDWQDELNDKNELFYQATDGIFTNYTWKTQAPQRSAARASDPKTVYTGIDVWGRNTLGGGKFNVHRAMREIAAAGTGAAVFGPGWVWEGWGKPGDDGNELQDNTLTPTEAQVPGRDVAAEEKGNRYRRPGWEQRERRFWCDATFPITEKDVDPSDLGCVATYVNEKPHSCALNNSFFTDFDRGYGTSYYINGQQAHDEKWTCHARQMIAPHYWPKGHKLVQRITISPPPAGATKLIQDSPSISVVPDDEGIDWNVVGMGPIYNGGSALQIDIPSRNETSVPNTGQDAWFITLFAVSDLVVPPQGLRVEMAIWDATSSAAAVQVWVSTLAGQRCMGLPDIKSLHNEGWKWVGLDVFPEDVKENQVTEAGIVVFPHLLGEATHIRIGAFRISPIGNPSTHLLTQPTTPTQIAFSVPTVLTLQGGDGISGPTHVAYIEAKWDAGDGIERWELFASINPSLVDADNRVSTTSPTFHHIGTSFTHIYRIGPLLVSSETSQIRIVAVGYDIVGRQERRVSGDIVIPSNCFLMK
ncbi:glycosyl hydrolase family 85-domain-containing protein [Phlyctochytrium arcticum]|nr:glycosyl hydrolase family 85-domain-containing protein [Phlyctochytrium arcticum]